MKPNLLRICSLLPASFPWVLPSRGDPRSFWGVDPSRPAWLCARGAAAGTPCSACVGWDAVLVLLPAPYLLVQELAGARSRAPSSPCSGVRLFPSQLGPCCGAVLVAASGAPTAASPAQGGNPPEMSEPALTLPAPKMSPVLFCLL